MEHKVARTPKYIYHSLPVLKARGDYKSGKVTKGSFKLRTVEWS